MARRAHGLQFGPDGRVRGGARRSSSPPRLQQAWQQRYGLLEVLTAIPRRRRPTPAGGSSERPSGVLAGPAPGLRPPAGPAGAWPPPPSADARPPGPGPPPSRTSSSIRPLSFLGRLRAHPRRTRPVISALAREFRGQSHVRHRAPFAGIPDESRRGVDKCGLVEVLLHQSL